MKVRPSMPFRSELLMCTALVGCLGANQAVAQQSAEAGSLEEITVTARKISENIIDVPVAITALTADQMEERGIRSIDDIAAFTPGLRNENYSVGADDRAYRQYIIRGVQPSNGLATRQTASIFVDGVLDFGGNTAGLVDIDHVETIKGPQAAYFGRGTFAGAVNYVTREPSLDAWHEQLNLDFSTYGSHDVTGTVEGPLVQDKLSVRLSGNSYEKGGEWSDPGYSGYKLGQQKTTAGSASLDAKPADNIKITSNLAVWRDDDGLSQSAAFTPNEWNCNAGGAPAGHLNYICGPIGNPPAYTRSINPQFEPLAFTLSQSGSPLAPNSYPLLGSNFITHTGLERHGVTWRTAFDYDVSGSGFVVSGNAGLDINKWARGFGAPNCFGPEPIDFCSVPNPYYGLVPPTNAAPNVPPFLTNGGGDIESEDHSWNGELRLTSPRSDRMRWMVGLNYFTDTSSTQSCQLLAAGFSCPVAESFYGNDDYSAFGSVAYDIVQGLTISAEGRYQREKITSITLANTTSPSTPLFSNTQGQFFPRFVLDYKPGQDVTYYASFSEGRRPALFNTNVAALTPAQQAQIATQVAVPVTVPGDELKMEEVGIKGDFLDHRLHVLTDVYYGDWDNRIIPQTVYYTLSNGLTNGSAISVAGGLVHVYGFEFEGAFKATRELTIEGTFDYAGSKNIKTDSASALILTGNADPTGKPLPFFPAISGTLSATYQRPVTSDWDGRVRVDWIYTGKIYDQEADLAWIPGHSVFNASIGLSRGNYMVEVYGKNIFNNLSPTSLGAITYAQYNAAGVQTGSNYGIGVALADKSTWGIRAVLKF